MIKSFVIAAAALGLSAPGAVAGTLSGDTVGCAAITLGGLVDIFQLGGIGVSSQNSGVVGAGAECFTTTDELSLELDLTDQSGFTQLDLTLTNITSALPVSVGYGVFDAAATGLDFAGGEVISSVTEISSDVAISNLAFVDTAVSFRWPITSLAFGDAITTSLRIETAPVSAVPVPPALPLLGAGLLALGIARRRRPSA